ncbi:MAG: DUF2283 domain-containing protein [Opitutales bacterium]|nr:DUF2283 domain-containing protein [Opitutales bacterium]
MPRAEQRADRRTPQRRLDLSFIEGTLKHCCIFGLQIRIFKKNCSSGPNSSRIPFGPPTETRELSEDVYLDLDEAGHVVSITVEHPSRRSKSNTLGRWRGRGLRPSVAP